MGKINSINEESVNNYQPLATHKGKTIDGNLDTLIGIYRGISADCFSEGDSSSVHMAVDMLISELADLQSTISGAEVMVDSLLDRIKNEILAEEDRVANSI